MPFPGFMAGWCFGLISPKASIKESQSLCAPLTHSPPETLSPLQVTRKTKISRTFINRVQKKLCKYLQQGELQCELSSGQIPRHPPGTEPQEWPGMASTAATAQALQEAAPRDVPAGNQAPAAHLPLSANLPCHNCSGQTAFGTFPMMLCVRECHRLIRNRTKAFPSRCLGFL